MANGDQIKALLRAYRDSDESQLLTLALQIAAGEAKAGHGKLAQDILSLVEELKVRGATIVPKRSPIPLAQPKGELADLVSVVYSPRTWKSACVECSANSARVRACEKMDLSRAAGCYL